MSFDISGIDLGGQVAIVTGGGRGLGREMALTLASANARVAVVARSEPELQESLDLLHKAGRQAISIRADVTDSRVVENMVQQVERELGPVDILVNNAGIFGTPGPIWEADPEEWRHVFDVNLYGVFLCTRAVLKGMIERQRGRIINVASGAGLSPIANGHAYCISKAALLRLTECVSAETQAHGISTFVINPGSVGTAMTHYLIESDAGRTYIPWYRELILAGGDVSADLSASLVTVLASGKADKLSGRYLDIADDLEGLLLQVDQIQKGDLLTLRLGRLPMSEN